VAEVSPATTTRKGSKLEYLDEEIYRNDTPGLSFSDMVHLLRSPAHYVQYKAHPPETTDAMRFGSAVHSAILEPEKFAAQYVVFDDSAVVEKIGGARPRTTKAYKEYKAEFTAANAGREILTVDDAEKIKSMVHAVMAHKSAAPILAGGVAEASFVWTDEVTGASLKARLDKVLKSGRVVDIKTCEDARPDAVMRTIWNYRYDVQGAQYMEAHRATHGVADMPPFTLIMIEKAAPHGLMVYEMDDLSLEVGEMSRRSAINTYAACIESGSWPAYDEGIQSISLPAWAAKDM